MVGSPDGGGCVCVGGGGGGGDQNLWEGGRAYASGPSGGCYSYDFSSCNQVKGVNKQKIISYIDKIC